ncbi:MAG: hypothetical protein J0H08_09475, partial [Rhizobiales bacterium]|nr:hypothetical protein [Hyphomicrobiales bacterium]
MPKPIIHVATLSASEPDLRRLADAIEADDTLAQFAVDAVEVTPEAWRLTLYMPEAPDKALRSRLDALAGSVLGKGSPGFAIERLP